MCFDRIRHLVPPFNLSPCVHQDNCVHVWDIGKATTIRTVFGPHICGDAVDVMGKTILTGSWRDDSQVRHMDGQYLKISCCTLYRLWWEDTLPRRYDADHTKEKA